MRVRLIMRSRVRMKGRIEATSWATLKPRVMFGARVKGSKWRFDLCACRG